MSAAEVSANGSPCCHEARRRLLCARPQHQSGARLGLVLELRRLQPDCASPLRVSERRPYNGFEFINSTQGGKNCLIYGIPTNITEPAPGFNIYRVRYDGAQMQVMENVSEATGAWLGVHVTVNPKDAQSYFVTDGQKDIAACFDRTTSQVKAALKFDWKANSHDLSRAWQDGGVLKISKIYPDPATGKYDYLGTKGQKIEWEMVPMGELFVEEGTLPGDDPFGLTGADGTIWHPSGRWAARLCACAAALLFSTRSAISSRPLSCNSMQAHRINTRSSKRQRIIGKSPSTRSTRRATRSVFRPTAASSA